ncbi:hypothetical protein Mgra_00007011 [Meloidogyne graminicola]|uniref:Uncharacterized protein n=1 Tax=Meloidogyne graminicola TaxID=189291 RepID=A0A8S9ZK01_9BILA|nr:hypothetical protein Mgra_00007011 [Meloidogyne graminicola]
MKIYLILIITLFCLITIGIANDNAKMFNIVEVDLAGHPYSKPLRLRRKCRCHDLRCKNCSSGDCPPGCNSCKCWGHPG